MRITNLEQKVPFKITNLHPVKLKAEKTWGNL